MSNSERTKIRKRLVKVMRDLEEVEREVAVFTNGERPSLDIVGTAEAADILGVKTNTVSALRSRGKFPEPAVVLAMGPVWLREDVEHFRDTR
jgi:prophage regulatory protein